MAEPLRPASTKTFGKKNWVLVKTVASAALIPTALEVAAGTSVDITRIAFASSARPTQSTNRATAERRIGDTKTYEFIGVSNVVGGTLTYVFAAQGATGSDGKKLYEAIPEGSTYVLVERIGKGRAVTPAALDWVNVYPIEFGPSFPVDAGQDESAESAMSAEYAVTDDPAINVQLT